MGHQNGFFLYRGTVHFFRSSCHRHLHHGAANGDLSAEDLPRIAPAARGIAVSTSPKTPAAAIVEDDGGAALYLLSDLGQNTGDVLHVDSWLSISRHEKRPDAP